MNDEILTPAEAAKVLKVNRQTVYDLCKIRVEIVGGVRVELDPELGHHRIGSKILIPRVEIDAFLQRTFHSAAGSMVEHRHRSRQAV